MIHYFGKDIGITLSTREVQLLTMCFKKVNSNFELPHNNLVFTKKILEQIEYVAKVITDYLITYCVIDNSNGFSFNSLGVELKLLISRFANILEVLNDENEISKFKAAMGKLKSCKITIDNIRFSYNSFKPKININDLI